MIDLDLTFLYQIGGFIALYFVLNNLLYKPVLKVLDERRRDTTGAKEDAEAMEKKLREQMQVYDNRLNDARTKAYDERMKLRKEAQDVEKELIEHARKDSLDSINATKKALDEEMKQTLESLKQEHRVLSKDIVEKILGRKVA